jgi:O-antigen/teichoic acid export membrane protein
MGQTSSAPPPWDSEVTGGRLLRNTLVNGLANVSGALVTLALTPFLLHRLGTAQYGVWLLALTLTFSNGYVALADLGLPEAAVRFIAKARAQRDVETISEIASTVTVVFALIGVVVGIVVAGFAASIVSLFGVSSHLASSARLVFLLMALVVVIDLPAAGLLAVIEGAQHYPWLRSIDTGARLAWAAIVVVSVSAGHGVVALAVAFVAVTAAEGVVAFIAAHRVEPGLCIHPRLATRKTLRQTFSYGSLLTVLRALSVLYAQMDRAIIGVALGVVAVARYEIAFRIETVATLALVVASSAVLPAAAYNESRGDTEKQRELYVRGSKYAVALALPITLSAMIHAKYIIIGWVGHRYAGMAGAARLFLAFPLFWCIHQVGISMLVGLGRLRRVVVLQLIATIVNLILSIVLVQTLGISGVIIGTLVGYGLVWWPYTRLLLDTFEITLVSWLSRVILPNVPGVLAQGAVAVLTLRLVSDHHHLWQVLAVCAASAAVNLGVFVLVGLNRTERSNLRHARPR